jgi:hypothetical protein
MYQTWVSTLFNARASIRTKIKDAVLDGMSYFRATYDNIKSDKPSPHYLLKSKNKEVENFVNSLKKETGLDFVGFVPQVTYIKEKGPEDHLEALWEHNFGTPALLYAHKNLPILIIAGQGLMFNDSIVRSIKSNNVRESIYGVTS